MKITMIKITKSKPQIEICTINNKINYVNYLFNDITETYLVIYSDSILSDDDMKKITKEDICNICVSQEIDIYENNISCTDFFTNKN